MYVGGSTGADGQHDAAKKAATAAAITNLAMFIVTRLLLVVFYLNQIWFEQDGTSLTNGIGAASQKNRNK